MIHYVKFARAEDERYGHDRKINQIFMGGDGLPFTVFQKLG